MKCQVVFLFVVVSVALVSADERPAGATRAKKYFDECQADPATFVDESVLKNLRSGNVDLAAIGPHALCMNIKWGIQKPNGDIDKEGLREALKNAPDYDETKADTIVEECGTRKGATAQEAAIALGKCWRKHSRRERPDN